MRSDHVLWLTLAVGAIHWAFRSFPCGEPRDGCDGWCGAGAVPGRDRPGGDRHAVRRSVLADVQGGVRAAYGPGEWASRSLIAGALSTAALWFLRPSVVLATLGGALAYGLVFALVA